MPAQIESFVNWLRRRRPEARTWRDYRGDLAQFAAVVGDRPPEAVTFHGVDRFVRTPAVGARFSRAASPPNRRAPIIAHLLAVGYN